MEFKIGYTVKLKSGGPEMTVSEVEARKVHVSWFNKGDSGWAPHYTSFKPEMLELLSDR